MNSVEKILKVAEKRTELDALEVYMVLEPTLTFKELECLYENTLSEEISYAAFSAINQYYSILSDPDESVFSASELNYILGLGSKEELEAIKDRIDAKEFKRLITPIDEISRPLRETLNEKNKSMDCTEEFRG